MKNFKGFKPIQNGELKTIKGGVVDPPPACAADCPDGTKIEVSSTCTLCEAKANPPKVICYAPEKEVKECRAV